MNKATDYKDLVVWQKAIDLATWIYSLTAGLPKEEIYGIVSQMRRAKWLSVISIQIAMGSASELEYHLLLARDLKYLNADAHKEIEDALIEVKRMLTSFIQKLRAER